MRGKLWGFPEYEIEVSKELSGIFGKRTICVREVENVRINVVERRVRGREKFIW